MRTITLSRVPAEELDQLEEAASKISPEIFDAVRALVGSVRDGAEIAAPRVAGVIVCGSRERPAGGNGDCRSEREPRCLSWPVDTTHPNDDSR